MSLAGKNICSTLWREFKEVEYEVGIKKFVKKVPWATAVFIALNTLNEHDCIMDIGEC